MQSPTKRFQVWRNIDYEGFTFQEFDEWEEVEEYIQSGTGYDTLTITTLVPFRLVNPQTPKWRA
jgi:hypothetical protein